MSDDLQTIFPDRLMVSALSDDELNLAISALHKIPHWHYGYQLPSAMRAAFAAVMQHRVKEIAAKMRGQEQT